MSTMKVDLDYNSGILYAGIMLTPEQSRAARAWLNMSQEELAQRAKVSLSTVRDFEIEDRMPIANNLEAIQRVFGEEGIAFSSLPGGPNGFEYTGRIKERDTYVPVLGLLAAQPDGFMKTTDLIRALELWFNPQGKDAEILANRSDTRFSQIIRNIISHQSSPSNLIGCGWAEHDKGKRGLRITPAGRLHLEAEMRKPSSPYSRA
jgi:transcriptional regulator with XRE-family HTH domain